ncbi:gamma-aminobutyric acid type B receptor subunit 2-like isoform X1, partial [Paramuricea clavata]
HRTPKSIVNSARIARNKNQNMLGGPTYITCTLITGAITVSTHVFYYALKLDARIIIGEFSTQGAVAVFCEEYLRNIQFHILCILLSQNKRQKSFTKNSSFRCYSSNDFGRQIVSIYMKTHLVSHRFKWNKIICKIYRTPFDYIEGRNLEIIRVCLGFNVPLRPQVLIFFVMQSWKVFWAYKMGLTGPKYVWLLAAAVSGAWIFSPGTFHRYYRATDCNVSQIVEAADGFIVSDKVPIRQDTKETLSAHSKSINAKETEFEGLTGERKMRETSKISLYIFETRFEVLLLCNMYIMTNSLRNSRCRLILRPTPASEAPALFKNDISRKLSLCVLNGFSQLTSKGLHNFNRRQRLGTVRINQMRNVNGIGRPVVLKGEGGSKGVEMIRSFINTELIQVGTSSSIDSVKSEMTLFESQLSKLWKAFLKESYLYSMTKLDTKKMLVVIGALAVFGLLYSIFFLFFNISKRNHKVVRMSSPMINNVVLLGCFFCYLFVLLLGIDSRFVDNHAFGILCNVRLYVLTIAFSLAFGALFSKTWRVHKIFTAQRAIKKKLMRDFHLILFVLALVTIDITFITIWIYYDPLEVKEIIFDELKEDSRDLITIPVLKICECTHRTKLLGALYGYKGILVLFGVFLAWETRNVTIPALNDSKYIGMSVYNVVILSAIGATVSMVLKRTIYYELLHVLVSAVVVFSTTVTLTMVFAPKVYEYYLAPPAPAELTRTMETLQMSATTANGSDVYEAIVKPKDVKHKCIQTEDFEQGNTVIGNENAVHNNGEMSTSGVNNGGDSVVAEGYLQDNERALMANSVYIMLCKDEMGSPMSMKNEGFSQDNEGVNKEQCGFITVE